MNNKVLSHENDLAWRCGKRFQNLALPTVSSSKPLDGFSVS
jgi:hypothetical protein